MNQEGKLYERPWGTYRTIEQRENYQIKHIVVFCCDDDLLCYI